ncbi:MAG TPA: hypothetical protein VFS60_09395, partial [Thermoanaerobaculia bacterium]|nr:hypothetical protein [Thermoanaerobaculia bacterium]
PPTFFEKWLLLLLATSAVLALVALLWYVRDRSELPGDFGYALAREGSLAPLLADAAPPAVPLRRLLGLAGQRPVVAAEDDRRLGKVHAVDEELFRFRPAPGVELESLTGGAPILLQHGAATLAVHRVYRLRAGDGSYLFRLEYR